MNTVTIDDKEYQYEDLSQDQQKLVNLLGFSQAEVQHKENVLVTLRVGMQSLQQQLIDSLSQDNNEAS